jgi:heme A synthase
VVFGLFHFTYPAPWNTFQTAMTVGLVWVAVSTLFALSRSLIAALLLDNIMATVGFATRGLTLPLPPATALVIAGLAIAAFVAAFVWCRRPVRPALPSPAPR